MEDASGQVKKKLLQGMSVLKQYCVYSDINDKEKHKGLNSELVLKKSYQFSLIVSYRDTT